MKRFREKTVVISGASSGIGAVIAQRFADEGADLALFAHPRDEGDLKSLQKRLSEQGNRVLVSSGDVSISADVERFIAEAVKAYGHIDIVINNAGYGYFENFLNVTEERWDRIIAVNLKGAFLVGQFAAKAMTSGGVIIYTASTNAFLGDESMCSYNVAKAGVVALTRTMALDLAGLGIRVVAVAPGMVHTRLTEGMLNNESLWNKYKTRIPLDRMAEPEEIAGLYLFLASEDASYLTGECITVDGGMTAGIRWSGWMAGETWQAVQKKM
ncbi:MAG TPA: SDR family oxidoreductase [Tepidisphaeraceae bacterium]|nr:SDR family oxidoreductase [Tepidisphaeraceae bacterium]